VNVCSIKLDNLKGKEAMRQVCGWFFDKNTTTNKCSFITVERGIWISTSYCKNSISRHCEPPQFGGEAFS
jgi:hypothetical protein